MDKRVAHLAFAAAFRSLSEQFSEFGWNVDRRVTPNGPPNGPTIYLCHLEAQQFYVVQLIERGVDKLKEMAKIQPISFQDACDALGTVLDEVATGHVALDRDARNAMAVSAGLYLSGTQIYQVGSERQPPLSQYVVIRHYDVSTKGKILRPAGYARSDPMTPSEVCEFVDQILAVDRKMHPERFRKAQVLKFRPKNV